MLDRGHAQETHANLSCTSFTLVNCKGDSIAIELSEKAKGLLKGKNFANVATVRKDGSPQVSPI